MMNAYFPEVKGNFGFGFMRLPMNADQVDITHTASMVDAFLESGFNYFDTAHGYISEQSEIALRKTLTSRYPREKYILANKLSPNYFENNEDIRPIFQVQLDACGVDYFDFYLMHCQNAELFAKYKAARAYETALELKAEGKIRHLGFSFHDKAEVLDRILTEYPQMEFVQIQFNYLDYESPRVESRKCYEVCRKHGKPVIVMEPVRGGQLVNLPTAAVDILPKLGGGSNASYAIRFAAGFEGIFMVLSGMSDLDMVKDNCGFMKTFKPLDETERNAVNQVADIINGLDLIPCTSCKYCVDGCPQQILIPDQFSCLNKKRRFSENTADETYKQFEAKASSCIGCGQCEDVCPQKLPIRNLLKTVAQEFEK